MKFGLAMDGLEQAIAETVTSVRRRFDPCTYLEIGVAEGMTLVHVSTLLKPSGSWRSVGVELPSGYSYSKDAVERNCIAQHMTPSFIRPNGALPVSPTWNRLSIVLCDSRDFFEGIWTEPIHLALIDGCHCKECVMRDFINIERYMPPGGVVMLHDYEKRINDPQPHGGHCDVTGAAEELGISNGTRDGWTDDKVFIADTGGANMLCITRS